MVTTLMAALLLTAAAVDDDQLPDSYTLQVLPHAPGPSAGGGGGVLGRQANGGVLGIETLPSFTSTFYFPGLVPTSYGAFPQFTWSYTMVGKPPFGASASEKLTTVNAPIVPVVVDLRNFDGSPRYFTRSDGTQVRMILDGTDVVPAVLNSPIFQNAKYGSSQRLTQYTDAIHRAQFFKASDDSWHTLLNPVVKPARTMVLIRGTYRFSADPTTGKLRYVLVDDGAFGSLLFPTTPTDTTTVMGAAEQAGDVAPSDLSTFLFNNVYLYQGGNPANCCVLGYHSYDVEPGSAANGWRERHYVMNYSSWISPGLFGGGFSDVTALSHELAEAFSDPFVANATPIWVAPNGLCQNNLEVGDVIEGLPNATYPMTMNGTTYHPQNEALLQWFAGQAPSSAFQHAYSFPDTTVLTSPSVSTGLDCSTPFTFPASPR
jgi:hypothetical protein